MCVKRECPLCPWIARRSIGSLLATWLGINLVCGVALLADQLRSGTRASRAGASAGTRRLGAARSDLLQLRDRSVDRVRGHRPGRRRPPARRDPRRRVPARLRSDHLEAGLGTPGGADGGDPPHHVRRPSRPRPHEPSPGRLRDPGDRGAVHRRPEGAGGDADPHRERGRGLHRRAARDSRSALPAAGDPGRGRAGVDPGSPRGRPARVRQPARLRERGVPSGARAGRERARARSACERDLRHVRSARVRAAPQGVDGSHPGRRA